MVENKGALDGNIHISASAIVDAATEHTGQKIRSGRGTAKSAVNSGPALEGMPSSEILISRSRLKKDGRYS